MRRAVGAAVALTTFSGCFSVALPRAAVAAMPAVETPTADSGWTVIESPSPPGQEDLPLRGIWMHGKETWAVGHAYADLFWKPWGVRCSQLSCSQLSLAGVGDSVVATAAAIDGTATSDVWVVGRQFVKHFDGATWEPFDVATLDAVTWSDVDAISPSDAWIVGTVQTDGPPHVVAAHWDGVTWQKDIAEVPVECGEGAEPQVVAANGSIQMSATCDGRGTVLVRDQLVWRPVLDTPGQIYGLDLVGGAVWATGTSPTVEPRVWRDKFGTWRRASAPKGVAAAITAMAGKSRNDRWAVGAVPFGPDPAWFVAHWDGSSWEIAAQPEDTVMPILYDVAIDAEGRPWAVGGETNGCPHPNCGDLPLLLRGPG